MRPSFAYLLRERRIALGLTQRQLGALVGIGQRQVSYFETDKALATLEQGLDLARVLQCSPDELGLPPFPPDSFPTPFPRGYLKQFGCAPMMHEPKREVSMRARIHTAIRDNPALEPQASRLLGRVDFELFSRFADCNSALEAEAWMNLADQDGQFNRASHARLGWDGYPIVDASGSRCLTGRLWPVLYFRKPTPIVIFPQVRIATRVKRYRLDMNVALGGNFNSRFFGVEIHGGGHRDSGDSDRPMHLRMPVITLSTADVRCKQLLELILDRYHSLPIFGKSGSVRSEGKDSRGGLT